MHAILLLVLMQRPAVHFAGDESELRRLCAISHQLEACTQFVEFELKTRCVLSGEQWTIEASATVRPRIFVRRNMQSLDHEFAHIEDIRLDAVAYVDGLTKARFDSAGECTAAAAAASSTFEDKLRGFVQHSTERRDH